MQIETKHKSQEGGHVTLDGSFSNLESGESVGDGIKMREKMLRVENFDEHDWCSIPGSECGIKTNVLVSRTS